MITSASALIGGTKIEGTLNSTALKSFTLDFYANTACDASGNGEGESYFGAVVVETDASGNIAPVVFAFAAGQFVTATATTFTTA